MSSLRKARPASVVSSSLTTSPAVGFWNARATSPLGSVLIFSLMFHSSSMESQLRFTTDDCRRPISAEWSPSPLASAMTVLRLVVEENWAKLSTQWIDQCRSCMSIASSSSTASSTRLAPS